LIKPAQPILRVSTRSNWASSRRGPRSLIVDSMSGAPAASTTTFEENGFTQERRVYADGSVGISEIELPAAELETGAISTQAVTGSTAAGVAEETQFRGCLVKDQSG
jgi:hypothetical protein